MSSSLPLVLDHHIELALTNGILPEANLTVFQELFQLVASFLCSPCPRVLWGHKVASLELLAIATNVVQLRLDQATKAVEPRMISPCARPQPVICTLMIVMVMTKMILMTSMMMVMVTVKIGTFSVVVGYLAFLDAIIHTPLPSVHSIAKGAVDICCPDLNNNSIIEVESRISENLM